MNEQIQQLRLEHLRAHPDNPRGPVDLFAPDIEQLANEIQTAGQLYHALNVVPCADGFRVVAGHRRFAALTKLRWESAPCIVRAWDEDEQFSVMMAENMQRQDLTPLQEAKGFVRMHKEEGEYSAVARRLGVSTAHIQSRVVILRLVPEVQALFDSPDMPTVAASSLVKVTDPERQQRLALLVHKRQLTTLALKQRVAQMEAESAQPAKPRGKPLVSTKVEYCRAEAAADLGAHATVQVSFADLQKAMETICRECGMGEQRAICGACALPQFIQKVVTAHA